MESLKVIEETRISPPPGSVPPTSLPCTYFDLFYLARPPVRLLYFYQSPQPKTILPVLKHSLSLALQHFFPLAGNLKWPQGSTRPHLVYKNRDSVALTIAESEFGFDELSDENARDVNLFMPIGRELGDVISSCEKQVPLSAFQVTFFRDKGICIGATYNHVAGDGKIMFPFVKAWAAFYNSIGNTVLSFGKDSLLPFFDRSSIIKGLVKPEIALLNQLKAYGISKDTFHTLMNHTSDVVPKDIVQARFLLRHNQIQELKDWIMAAFRNEPDLLRISSFSVTCAYVWVCLIKARWGQMIESLPDVTEHLLIPVDARAHLEPALPPTYFGNCLVGLEIKAKRSELLGEQGIIVAAKLIAKGIQSLDVLAEVQRDMSYFATLPPQQTLTISNSPKFNVYQTDFGWGKPKRVICSSDNIGSTGCVNLYDSPHDTGGIEIGLVCTTIEFNAFVSAFSNSFGFASLFSKL